MKSETPRQDLLFVPSLSRADVGGGAGGGGGEEGRAEGLTADISPLWPI